MRNVGYGGYNWTSTAYPSSNQYIYYTNFSNDYVYPSAYYNRFYGFTDRKAAPTTVAVRREDVSAIEIEAVRRELRRVGADSPVVAIVARVPQRTKIHIYIPATS